MKARDILTRRLDRYVQVPPVTRGAGAPMFSDTGNGETGFELNPNLLEKQDLVHQGESAERIAQKWEISREDLDAFATESHRRASAAAHEGKNKEILPTSGLDPDGNEIELTTDEGIRHNIEAGKMASLKTVFRPEGEGGVTAGNSSQLTDGASAVLVVAYLALGTLRLRNTGSDIPETADGR